MYDTMFDTTIDTSGLFHKPSDMFDDVNVISHIIKITSDISRIILETFLIVININYCFITKCPRMHSRYIW